MADPQTKLDFIQAFDVTLPDGVLNKADTAIPSLENTSMPTDAETAIIAQGILAHNLNTILKAFEGLTPIDLILHIGQRNAVNKAIFLASIQAKDKGGKHDIDIIQPASGPFDLTEELLFCEVELFGDLSGLEEVSVTLTKPDETSNTSALVNPFDNGEEVFDEDNHFYTEIGLYDEGEHTLEFSATVDGYTFTAGPITITAS